MNDKKSDSNKQRKNGAYVTLTPQQSQFAAVLGFELATCWNEEHAAESIDSGSANNRTSKNRND